MMSLLGLGKIVRLQLVHNERLIFEETRCFLYNLLHKISSYSLNEKSIDQTAMLFDQIYLLNQSINDLDF